jgi:hypothetical protein
VQVVADYALIPSSAIGQSRHFASALDLRIGGIPCGDGRKRRLDDFA